MPMRDYRCKGCGHGFEHLSKSIVRTCPKCGEKKVEVEFNALPAYHALYSPMHPRKGRGSGNSGRAA